MLFACDSLIVHSVFVSELENMTGIYFTAVFLQCLDALFEAWSAHLSKL